MSSYAKISTSLYCVSNVNWKHLRREESMLSLRASGSFKDRFPCLVCAIFQMLYTLTCTGTVKYIHMCKSATEVFWKVAKVKIMHDFTYFKL